MDPGEFVTLQTTVDINENDGEFGLYTTNSFGSSSAITDYVEWGSTGHGRSSVAVGAGIWTTGDFAQAWAAGSVLEYDGAGDSSSDWSQDAPSLCAANAGRPNPVSIEYTIYPNPSSGELSLDFKDERVSGDMRITIYNSVGTVEASFNMDVTQTKGMRMHELESGTYYMKIIQNGRVQLKPFIIIQ